MHTLIIGGGAAGMAAAIEAARLGQQVTVLERGRKILKKLGVTGNGRGNLLNSGEPVYYGDTAFALEVLRHMPYGRIAAFLMDCGISLAEEEEGRIYPACYLAGAAVDALKWRAQQLGVKIIVNTRVTALAKHGSGFAVSALEAFYAEDTQRKSGKTKPGALLREEPVRYTADRVIVTVGGAAAPAHGTDGTAYGLLTDFGHTMTDVRPALCALLTDPKAVEGLSGQRVRAKLHLSSGAESAGEALFADDGVSGIAAMQLSRFVRPGDRLTMDLREAVMGQAQHEDAEAWLQNRLNHGRTMETLLVGAASPQLSRVLLRRAGGNLSELANLITAFDLELTGTRGFDMAQVTAGGVAPSQFDPATMQSCLVPGLYAAGEVLDVDGACGGFNLMFAFATGLLAGRG